MPWSIPSPTGRPLQAEEERAVPLRAGKPGHLPSFVDRNDDRPPSQRIDPAGLVQEGLRHTTLKRRAHELALEGRPHPELTRELLAFRDEHLVRPDDFPDEDMAALARWFCQKRSDGRLWGGSCSAVPIERSAIDLLLASGDGVATQLFLLLSAYHQHQPDAPFAIVPDALLKAGRIKAGRRQIYNAIALLVELGLLVVAQPQRKPKEPKLYALQRSGCASCPGPINGQERTSIRIRVRGQRHPGTNNCLQ